MLGCASLRASTLEGEVLSTHHSSSKRNEKKKKNTQRICKGKSKNASNVSHYANERALRPCFCQSPLKRKAEHAIREANCAGHGKRYGFPRAGAIKHASPSASYTLKTRYFICLITSPHHNPFYSDLLWRGSQCGGGAAFSSCLCPPPERVLLARSLSYLEPRKCEI